MDGDAGSRPLDAPLPLGDRVVRGLRSPFPAVRAWACTVVGRKEVTVGSAQIVELLEDQSDDVLRAAVRTSGLLGISSAVPRLIELLNADDADLALQAAWSLEIIGRASWELAPPPRDPPPPPPPSPPPPAHVPRAEPVIEYPVGIADLGVQSRLAMVVLLVAAFVGGATVGRFGDVGGEVKEIHFDSGRLEAEIIRPTPTPPPPTSQAPTVLQEPPTPAVPLPPSPPPSDDMSRRHRVLLSTAQRYLTSGRVNEALAIIDRVLAEDPASSQARGLRTLAAETWGVLE